MSDWTVQDVNLISPAGIVYVQQDNAAARAIKAALDAEEARADALQGEKDNAFLTAKEEAREQRGKEMLDFFRERDATMRDDRARRG